jgi:hypothetical protein
LKETKPSRLEEARRLIEEYVADLRDHPEASAQDELRPPQSAAYSVNGGSAAVPEAENPLAPGCVCFWADAAQMMEWLISPGLKPPT